MEQLNMVRLITGPVPEPVAPDGVVLRTYREGDEQPWADIVNTTDMGREYDVSSVRESLTRQGRFDPDGLFFAADARTGQALATACAWWTYRFGRLRPTLHMVAGRTEARGRGLGKLVCQAVVRYFAARGQREVVLTTDEHRLPALATYGQLGFLPMRYVGREDHAGRWEAAWRNFAGRLGPLRFAGAGRPVTIGVLGLRRGAHLAEWIRDHPAAAVEIGCDFDEPLRARFTERFPRARTTARYEDLLDGPVQAIIVAHDCPDHAPAALAALRAGRDVLSEVTAFHTVAEGVELVEAVEGTGRAYMMAENCLYSNAMMELAHQGLSGALGGLQYAEGDYVHDCRDLLTRSGQRYWRSWLPPLLYCTHPLGPILRATGQRPVRVVGMHTGSKLSGTPGGIDAGAMLIACAGGGVVRVTCAFAVNREPASLFVCCYGTKASLETDRWEDRVYLYRKGDRAAAGPTGYRPTGRDGRAHTAAGHFGADPRTLEYWLESLADGLVMPVDVYEAADMTLPGILAHRSSLSGSVPLQVPDLRDLAAREAHRHDRARPDPDDPRRLLEG